MKLKDLFVYVMLIAGVIAGLGGMALVSRDVTYGWAGIALAVPLLFVVQRSMRLSASVAPTPAEVGSDAPSLKS